MKNRKLLGVGATVVALSLALAGVANADISKSGTKNCSGNYAQGALTSYASGTVTHHPPGGGVWVWTNSVQTTDYSYGVYLGGGAWSFNDHGGTVSDPLTYAYCDHI